MEVVTVRSLDDLVRRVGVSAATVSRALRGLPGVSASTRARIVVAAPELEYAISPCASRLASGRTRTVGAVVPYVNRWFFGQVITGFERRLREAGYDLLLYGLGDEAGRERFFGEMPLRRRVDAVLVIGLPLTDNEAAALRFGGRPGQHRLGRGRRIRACSDRRRGRRWDRRSASDQSGAPRHRSDLGGPAGADAFHHPAGTSPCIHRCTQCTRYRL
jgi:hypothetical protein